MTCLVSKETVVPCRRESEKPKFGIKQVDKILNTQHFIDKAVKFLGTFLDYIETCLVNEMLCIQDLKPALNVQSDSPRTKVFM